MNLWHFNLYHVIFALATLTYSKQADEKTCIWSMIFLSLGGYLAGLEYSTFIFAICVFSTLAVCEWSSGISLSVYLISFIAVSFFINDVNFDINSAIISAVAGGLVFLAVPHKKIKEISAKNKYASQKDIINRDRSKIAIKIEELSSCFLKIAQGYNEIAKSKYKQSDSIKYITCETIKHICENCDKFSFCNKSDVWRNAELDYLSQCAMQKGKTTMLDFGDFISSSCVRKVDLLGEINKIASNAKNQVLQLEEKQKSKEEVARTYQRVAVVLEKLSLEASKKISFDSNAQLEISQALDKATVFYRELFIYQNENKCVCVELFARKDDAGEILSCIERIFGYNFHLASSRNQYEDSCDYMIFCKSPRVNVEYGYATKPKKHGHPNGDSMTIINLPDARFVCVICDGMGSGESAHEFSQKAVSFIENLFSAGFVASDIITNVNSFMENCEYNSYATLDILEIDLYSEKAYLYKVGSPDTYFQSTKTHLISSKALPIGIMKEIKLEINSFGVSKGDKIILTSDGVLDFMRAEIENGINNKSFVSSQVFADRIMQECDKKMTRGSSDDRTIIAIEII
ncbi:MAG: SpoIIE family protein phosphatase [Bacillota bacterium]